MTKHTVWVIDDDRAIRWVLERALTQAGLAVSSVEDATSALTRLKHEQPMALVSLSQKT